MKAHWSPWWQQGQCIPKQQDNPNDTASKAHEVAHRDPKRARASQKVPHLTPCPIPPSRRWRINPRGRQGLARRLWSELRQDLAQFRNPWRERIAGVIDGAFEQIGKDGDVVVGEVGLHGLDMGRAAGAGKIGEGALAAVPWCPVRASPPGRRRDALRGG
jgi:hypothetical protein